MAIFDVIFYDDSVLDALDLFPAFLFAAYFESVLAYDEI